MDPRCSKLAKNIVEYSLEVKKGDKVLIKCSGDSGKVLVKEIIKEVYNAGGLPFVELTDNSIDRELLKGYCQEQVNLISESRVNFSNKMDCYVSIRSDENSTELSDVSSEKMKLLRESNKENYKILLNKRWVGLRYITNGFAQSANMSLEAFEDYFYNVCNVDYKKMSNAMDKLVSLMEKTDRVRITGKETDLTFSIKDIPVIKAAGENNIPDGEVFTAPVKNSVNGTIRYTIPSNYEGITFENIKLEFKDGKIIKAEANDIEKINKILNTDEGSRYIGEFAFGVNPYITKPIGDILFDEKISGSIHFTPGMSYDYASNGNSSNIHWDIVSIQTPEYGGGEIYFDDKLIRKDGLFVLPELECLNPENLK